ncbi:hypothetical protein F5Y04DRAFT_251257 [Hypomontagnella monticulosa]|nr:hypothetical protein F5Y04DRAFT_251257 [Hypomontagnella monticulosa]
MESSFPQFRHLPSELRCKIWRLAIPGRTVFVRLKLDLDAWNAATETDWMQTHYRLVPDGQLPPLPAVALVNREAWHEVMTAYAPFRISEDVRRRTHASFSTCMMGELDRGAVRPSADDAALDLMYDGARVPHFNMDTDALEWSSPGRWATKSFREPCLLFLAACLSVRYVSIEYDQSMCVQLEDLVLAFLDPDQPLETLTIGGIESRYADRFLTKIPRFRLARTPPGPKYFLKSKEDLDDLDTILARHEACFLPWEGALRNDVRDSTTYPAQIQTQMQGKTSPHGPNTHLWPWLAIFQISGPDEPEGYPPGGFVWPPNGEKEFDDLKVDKQFRDGDPVDVIFWLRVLLTNHTSLSPPLFSLPSHGFCRPGYGLPAPHDQ